MREWFAQLILYSQALTLAGEYAAFGELGGAVLQMVADTRRQPVSAENVLSVKQAIASMPAHPEVPEALRGLRDAGFRLFTLTNNPARTATEQLERAGLADFFERQFSVDVGTSLQAGARNLSVRRAPIRPFIFQLLHDRLPYMGYAGSGGRWLGRGSDRSAR